ncbi:MAG: hypothetical protein GF419_05555 [Ignavibacteriales bacterium]|nr:hypothetical protein [Ignavibacteriales bacterium]
MFEKEIQELTNHAVNQILPLAPSATLDQLAAAGLHPAIVRFISSELDYMIHRERHILLEHSYFDYSDRETIAYFEKISQIIKRKKKLPIEDVKRLINQAVTLNVNYLLRPKRTLAKFIFSSVERRTDEEIRILLNYIHFYDHIKKIILTVLDVKGKDAMTLEEFKTLLDDIQSELIESQRRYVIESGLYSMTEFFNLPDERKRELSVGAAVIFLYEKEMDRLIVRIKDNLSDDSEARFTLEVFRSVLLQADEPDEPNEAERKLAAKADEWGGTERIDAPPTVKKKTEPPKEKPADRAKPKTYKPKFRKPKPRKPLSDFDFEKAKGTGDDLDLDALSLSDAPTADGSGELVDSDVPTADPSDDVSFEDFEPNIESAKETLEQEFLEYDQFESFLNDELTRVDERDEHDGDAFGGERDEHDGEAFGGERDDVADFLAEASGDKDDEFELEDLVEDEASGEQDEEFDLPEKTKSEERGDPLAFLEDAPAEEKSEPAKKSPPTKPPKKKEIDLVFEEFLDDNDDYAVRVDRRVDDKTFGDRPEVVDRGKKPFFRGRGKKQKAKAPTKDVFEFFDTRETTKIIYEIFNEDHVDFVNTVERIAEAPDYADADAMLQRLFRANNVGAKSKTARLLTERVEQFFAEKG